VNWLEQQRAFRAVLLAGEPAEADLEELGEGRSRWLFYRRMVRSRLADLLGDAFERFRAAVGGAAFAELVDRFLAERPPASHFLRDVPADFLEFLRSRDLATAPRVTGLAMDIARFEAAELEVGHLASPHPAALVPLDMNLRAVVTPAMRLLDVEHDPAVVAGGSVAQERAIAASSPRLWTLCVYRDPRTDDVETLELTPVAARILRGIEQSVAPLSELARTAAAAERLIIDAGFAEALGVLLADLVERGVLLGSRPASD
jgi:hypothetical protein